MTRPPVRLAVVGAGHLGRYHAEKTALLAPEGVALAAVVDVVAERARAVAAPSGAAWTTELREVLDRIDAAVVAVPTTAHLEVARALLEADKDVLVEKPLAPRAEEARALTRLARARRRILQVGHLERFNPAFRAIRPRIRTPLFIEAHRLAGFQERGTEVDVVLDLMIHDLDLVLSMVPGTVRSVHAVGGAVFTETVDIANARIEFASGCVANLTASRVSREVMRKIRIFQPDAYFSVDLAARQALVCRKSEPPDPPGMSVEGVPAIEGDALEEELRSFLRSVTTREPPPVTGSDGTRAVALAAKIRSQIERRVERLRSGVLAGT